jgi:hypothetical protein
MDTNAVFLGTNVMVCYRDHVVLSTTRFTSPNPITFTNSLPNGTYCVTVPILGTTTVFSGTNQMICYMDGIAINTNIFTSAGPIAVTNTLPNGTYCISQTVATNTVPSTYEIRMICYSNEVLCTWPVTNFVSFSAKVVPEKRLTLVATTTFGSVSFRGVPAAPVAPADLTGPWYGSRKQDGVSTFEFFDIQDTLYSNLYPLYAVQGEGPGYAYDGVALVSSQKKIAFALSVAPDTDTNSVRAVFGAINTKALRASIRGIEGASGSQISSNQIVFDITKRTTVP